MKKLEIFEPSMCFGTGASSANNELLRLALVLKEVSAQGGQMHMYNLATDSQMFLQNTEVIAMLDNDQSELSITVLDGKIVLSKRYPTNAEIETYLNISLGNVQSAESNKTDEPRPVGHCC